jgi:hypothetical protein
VRRAADGHARTLHPTMHSEDIPTGAPSRSRVPTIAPSKLWPLLAALVSAATVPGLVNGSEIVYIRDAACVFWPVHLWFRHEIFAGGFPLWNPFVAFGQSAIADPAHHLLFPPVVLLRILFPDVLGFNLTMALPFPIATVGMYLLLRSVLAPSACALGAIAFGAAGPVLSMGNMLNASWSVALVPWALWAVGRLASAPSARSFALAAALFALQLLAGEPVTLAGTAVLAVAFAATAAGSPTSTVRERLTCACATVGAGLTGLLIAAPQVLPLVDAATRSYRVAATGAIDTGEWSLHPLTLVEAVVSGFWGDYLDAGLAGAPWIAALNSGSGPFLHSTFVGLAVLALAAYGATSAPVGPERRWAYFWATTAVVALVWALGEHTPAYAGVMAHIPVASSFRYPSKFAVFAALALAALAALGWHALAPPRRAGASVGRVVAVTLSLAVMAVAGGLLAVALAAPDATLDAFARLASSVGANRSDAASFAVESVRSAAPRAAGVAAAVAACAWLAASPLKVAPAARALLFALATAELLLWNTRLNPTLDADVFDEPGWVARTRDNPGDRVYVAGKAPPARRGVSDVDLPPGNVEVHESVPFVAARAVYESQLAPFPAGWRIREAISTDPTQLWPAGYTNALHQFSEGSREARARFLRRTGVRYFFLPAPPAAPHRLVAAYPRLAPLALYEGEAPTPRAFVARNYAVEPDVGKQTARLYEETFDPASEVLLASEPPEPAGVEGAPASLPSARLVSTASNEVRVVADVPAGGSFLVLMDSFHPDWIVEVDGQKADVLRADGLFRAVRVSAGEHAIRFAYRPRAFFAGGVVSGCTLVGLFAACLMARARRKGA